MRIAMISLHHGEYVSGLARALAREHKVLLILNRANFDSEVGDARVLANVPGLTVQFLPHDRNAFGIVPRAVRLACMVRAFRPHIIHCQEDTKDYLALALPFIGRTPFVLTVHDPRPHSGLDARRQLHSRHGIYTRQLRARANAAIVHGDRLVSVAEQVMPHLAGRVYSIPHGPNGSLFERPVSGEWRAGHCLFFGRIEAYKGLPYFIEAIRMLRRRGVPVKGVIAGRGTELDRLKLGLVGDPAFEIKDRFLSPVEVRACFRETNIVVMPYLDATQSGVAAYALGMGRPVVATRVGGLPDMIRDGVTGILVPPRNSEAVAEAINALYEHPERARAMGEAAIALSDGELSWREIAVHTGRVYASLTTAR